MSSGSEDFGPLMDVLVTCVGAVDVISVLALICNNSSTNTNDSLMDINNNEVKAFQDDKIRDKSPRPMIVMDKNSNGDVIDSLMSKVNELEAKVEELEVRSRECSMERFLDEERERFINTNRLRRSQSPTPDHNSFLEHENESNENDESATDESHVDDITHDDGEIKRSSQVSQQHESREKEINDTNDCTQLAYHSDIDANGESQHHLIESIKEIPTCPKEIESSTLDVNENFIRMEQLQTQSPKMLMKQANVFSEDFPEETINEVKKNEEPLPINATESKTAEDIMAHVNVSSHPKIEKFPKSNEIETAVDETAIELISTKFESLNLIENEELAKAKEEPSVIVQNYAQVLATETFIDEQVNELPPPPQNVEIINEPQSVIGSLMDVNINPSINLQTKDASISANSSIMNLNASTASLQSGNTSLASAALDNDYAVRRRTPEPEVSIDVRESSIEKELLNVGGDSLRRTKRCINSLDRSASRSSSRLSRRSKKSKSPSVASEEDYKEWFEKFDNHLSSELTLPENDDDDDEAFDSDMEEELLMDADIGNLDGAEICNIDEDRDVSVSITLNLKQKQPKQQQDENECHPCKEFQEPKVFQTKAEEIEEMQKQWETKGRRRLSILPSTDEQQKNYVSMLHPEEFPASIEQREPHQHHEHLHNVGYSEWMKKMVDHHSCHLALDDSESDSDVPLDEVQMLPLFCDEQEAKKKQNRRRKK